MDEKRARLLELLRAELEDREEQRQYRWAVEQYTRPADAAPAPAKAPAEQGEYLDTRAAAALLGVSVKGLEAMRARGNGPPFIRVGNRVRYRRSDLLK